MEASELISGVATLLGVVVTSFTIYRRSTDWILSDTRVVKIAEGLDSMEAMTKLSGQLRELGQDDWADELETSAYRIGMKPLAVFDDRRRHPAPFIVGTAVIVSTVTFVLSVLGIALWPGVAPTVALVSFVLILASSAAWLRSTSTASKRRQSIVIERVRNCPRDR